MKAPFKRILAAIARSASAQNLFNLAIAHIKQNCKHQMLAHCLSLKSFEQMGKLIDAGFGLSTYL
ncbi:MAG: hypothetical protein RMX99_022255 [Aulosira sp. DedVER01a]|nr:hypothetical protein [Aulosira sp. ZfuVER01]